MKTKLIVLTFIIVAAILTMVGTFIPKQNTVAFCWWCNCYVDTPVHNEAEERANLTKIAAELR